jgi:lipopolysaccharide exporter
VKSSSETTPPDEGGGVPNSLLGATVSGVRWMSLARVAGELIAIGSLIVLARLITPAEFGAFAVALVVTELALTIPGEGVGTALVQQERVAKEHLEAAFFLSLLIGLLLGAAVFIVAPYVFTPLFGATTTELVQIATPMFLIAALTAVPMATAQRRLDFRVLGLAQIASLIVRAGTSVALALAGLNGSALMIGMLAGATATLGVLLTTERLPWPRPHRRGIREIAGFGVPAALSGMTWTGFRNADFAIVAARLGALDAGLYWRAYQLAIEYQRKIGSLVHQVTFPVYSRAGDIEEMFELRRRVVRLVGALLVPGLAGLAVVAPVFVPWVFGDAWSAAVVPTQILAIAGMVTVASDTL